MRLAGRDAANPDEAGVKRSPAQLCSPSSARRAGEGRTSSGKRRCPDLPSRARAFTFTAPRIDTRNTHGTGCTLSSAIAAHLARGATEGRGRGGEDYLTGALAASGELSVGSGEGHGPVHHFHDLWNELVAPEVFEHLHHALAHFRIRQSAHAVASDCRSMHLGRSVPGMTAVTAGLPSKHSRPNWAQLVASISFACSGRWSARGGLEEAAASERQIGEHRAARVLRGRN